MGVLPVGRAPLSQHCERLMQMFSEVNRDALNRPLSARNEDIVQD
jgi:hypothetical protein